MKETGLELHKFPYSSQGYFQIYEFSSVFGKDNWKLFFFLEKAIGEMTEQPLPWCKDSAKRKESKRRDLLDRIGISVFSG